MSKVISTAEIIAAKDLINDVCAVMNLMLVEAKAAFRTKTVSQKVFYTRLNDLVESKYRKVRMAHEANNDLAGIFVLNIIQTMLIDNVKNQDIHKVKKYAGEITNDGKVNFHCEFN